jgi:arylsulfatase A-like enzyme
MVDWYPTLLNLAGAPLAQKLPVDGRDIWPVLTTGAASPHQEILLNTTPVKGAIRVGDWKLVLNGSATDNDGEDPAPTPAPKKAKKAAKAQAHPEELFNLADDPYEKNNLAPANPAKVKELRQRYDGLAKQAVPPRIQPKTKDFALPKVWGEK